VALRKEVQSCWNNATKQEVSEEYKKKKELHKTDVFPNGSQIPSMLTLYQCKSMNNMTIFSSLHLNAKFQAMKIRKRNPTQYSHAMTPK